MNKKICAGVCVILTFIMFFANMSTTYSNAASTSLSSIQQQKNDVQSKIEAAKKEIDKLSSEMSAVQKQISELNAQISIYQDSIDTLQKQIDENEATIVQLEADYEKRGKALASRIVAQYESGEITYLDFLLSSESLTDFISNYYVLGELVDIDNGLLTEIEETKTNIETTKKQLEEDKATVEEQMNIVKQKASELEESRKKLAQERSATENNKSSLNSKMQELEKQEQKLLEEERKQNGAAGYVGSFSGTLSWPLSTTSRYYNLITYGYGPRNQPTAGASTNHKALDIAVSYQPVYAPADGCVDAVITESNSGGYGNYIKIKHSDNLYTCYGHLSSFNVTVGQTVTRGYKIGTSGNTGISSGPHLHWEVRVGSGTMNDRVNPLNYISKETYSKLIFCF